VYGYPYVASKAGLIHLTKMLSTEFASYGIRANTIAPGLYLSEATDVSISICLPGSRSNVDQASFPGMLLLMFQGACPRKSIPASELERRRLVYQNLVVSVNAC
jgi:NAD(P)-dependent dehydrogenase (short-subunit alcohol dehydrogenase family)